MDKAGKLICEDLLSGVELAALPFVHLVYLLKRQEGQHSQALENIGVADIAPILIEIIGRGLFGVEPNRAGLGFTHLLALGI